VIRPTRRVIEETARIEKRVYAVNSDSLIAEIAGLHLGQVELFFHSRSILFIASVSW
jgi:hypothetical protein